MKLKKLLSIAAPIAKRVIDTKNPKSITNASTVGAGFGGAGALYLISLPDEKANMLGYLLVVVSAIIGMIKESKPEVEDEKDSLIP